MGKLCSGGTQLSVVSHCCASHDALSRACMRRVHAQMRVCMHEASNCFLFYILWADHDAFCSVCAPIMPMVLLLFKQVL